jgi:hypothetical protein
VEEILLTIFLEDKACKGQTARVLVKEKIRLSWIFRKIESQNYIFRN